MKSKEEITAEKMVRIYGHSRPKDEPNIPLGAPRSINEEECIKDIKELISNRKGN